MVFQSFLGHVTSTLIRYRLPARCIVVLWDIDMLVNTKCLHGALTMLATVVRYIYVEIYRTVLHIQRQRTHLMSKCIK